ncbi:acyl transferase/acyl hydrolase/lysophospholipase, partial [Fusarium redolens]
GICILTLAHKRLPITEAIQSFLQLSASVFKKQPFWRRAMNLLLHGSIYCNSAINRPLEQHYGTSTLSNYSPAVSRGAKLFVTAKGTPCRDYIITNFMAPGSNKAHNDYQHALPDKENGGIQVWEAARATSAAPVMFTPHSIPGVGTFQDGGLWQNNPLAVALSEARDLWPSANIPDVALSIGTGFHKGVESSTAGDAARLEDLDPRRTLSDGNELANTSDHVIINFLWKICFFASILRLLLSLMDSPAMDSDKCQRYITRHGLTEHQARERTFRVNVDFPVECPRMDDLNSMQDVRQEAIKQFSRNSDIQKIAELLISSLFFLELTERPCRHETYISFQGRILCDVSPGRQLQRLLSVLLDHRSVFEVCGRLFPLAEMSNDEAITMDFELHVNGTVTEFTTPFTVSLIQSQPSGKVSCPISRSPLDLKGVMTVQGWDCPFIERSVVAKKRRRGTDFPGVDDLRLRRSKKVRM